MTNSKDLIFVLKFLPLHVAALLLQAKQFIHGTF